LEAHVAEIRHSQVSIHAMLADIQAQLRSGSASARSPAAYPQPYPPTVHSPAVATPTNPHDVQSNPAYPHVPSRPSRSLSTPSHHHSGLSPTDQQGPSIPLPIPNYAQNIQHNPVFPGQQIPSMPPVLPPFSSIRFHHTDNGVSQRRPFSQPQKRSVSSNVHSGDSSGAEEEEGLPAKGLVAPWEVLRGLADVAIERAAQENGDSSEPQSRARTPSPERQGRPTKRRKIRHTGPRVLKKFPDVVTENILTEAEACELFRIFYHGCSTFL
jgi:hypothetical protein